MTSRQYPLLPDIGISCRPLSIVCVQFSSDYFHNFVKSECVRDPAIQVIVVDNRDNAHFANLGEAMNAGIRQAKNSVVIIVHEDVLLPNHWQQHFEIALRKLEGNDPNWGILGVCGRLGGQRFEGHLSDPYAFTNTLGFAAFRQADWLDEQLLVLKNDGVVLPDPNLPSIHCIGRDLIGTARLHRRAAYIINAPTIHKYADAEGKIIQSKEDSPKIMDRLGFGYKAEEACAREYFDRKWNTVPVVQAPRLEIDVDQQAALESPVILVAQGGSASRLVSSLAEDFGLFIGGNVNVSGDSLEMVMPIYMGIIRKFSCKALWQKGEIVQHLRRGAAEMLQKAGWPEFWGFKLSESIYLIPEIKEAFPQARFLHLLRDPLGTCLWGSHMTGRVDNQIGRAVIPHGYDYVGRVRSLIHSDSVPMRMAVTTVHQLAIAFAYLPADRTHVVHFESVIEAPDMVTDEVSKWFDRKKIGHQLATKADRGRAENPPVKYSAEVETEVRKFLTPLRLRLNYIAV
jgi:hypothetical protein